MGCFYVTALLSWGWFEAEVEVRLRWGWVEVSWNWVEVELSWGWDKLTLNKERNWAFIGLGLWFKIRFRSTHAAEQHKFSMSPSIFAFEFF